MKVKNENIKRVISAKNADEVKAGYREWAAEYDKDLNELGYMAPALAVRMLHELVEDKGARILDAGCGTGLVGELLQAAGYTNTHALDYSQAMLEQAEGKDIYESFTCADMNKTLELPDNSYDAVICVGAFTYGHVTPDAFAEIIRITKPGGIFCFTVREEVFHEQDYRKQTLQLEVDEAWELLELRREDYIKGEDTFCRLLSYRIT